MRVVVFGGRNFCNERLAFKALDILHKKYKFTCVIDGCAKGADTLGYRWAKRRGVPTERYPANWAKFGLSAGPIRNRQMIDEGKPDIGVAFPGGKGTANMKEQMKRAGIRVYNIVPVAYQRKIVK
jgi:hypothetical protein